MTNLVNKVKKLIVVTAVTCLCLGCMSVFADSVIRKGNNIGLTELGTSNQHVITMSDIKYVSKIGPNYVFKSITDNTSGKYNYVKSTVQSKSFWGKWSTLGTVTKNHPTTGAVYCPRISPGLTRVYGVRMYASNKFSKGQTGYGKIAECKTSSTYGFVSAQ